MKKISIILPIYNVEKYLGECLDSILSQTLKDIEIICVNDGSSDNCLSIIEKYKKIDDRIVIINQENQGSGTARNNGLKVAKGEYIVFMDPDDYYYSDDVLFELYKKAKENNVDLCGGNFVLVYEDGEDCNIKKEERKYKETTNYSFSQSFLGVVDDYKSASWFWRFIFSNDFLKKNYINFPDYERFQDVPFLAKSLSLCQNIYFMNKIIYCYRVNHRVRKYSKKQQRQILSALKDCFDIYYMYKKYVQYSDIFTIFIEMIDVFSGYIDNEEIDFINEIYRSIDFSVFNDSFFPEKIVKNLKGIISNENYKMLKTIGKYYD